jgi:hypothetical protein
MNDAHDTDSANIERKLTAALYRLDCPDTAELGEYHFNFLASARQSEISRHLQDCPHCASELAQLRHFLADVAPDLRQGVYNPLKVFVARLISQATGAGGGMGGVQPAFALRGDDRPPRVYEAGDAQIVLEVQDEPSVYKTLLGLVLGVDPAGLTAHLWRGEDAVSSAELDEMGNFILANIEPGSYEIVVRGSELEIHIPSMDV